MSATTRSWSSGTRRPSPGTRSGSSWAGRWPRGEDVVAQIWLHGRGRHSQIEVKGVEAGHLVRFRDLKIVEFLAFPTWDLAVQHLEDPA
jgi:hypothetical protein